jgi:putative NADH-flavin reductase
MKIAVLAAGGRSGREVVRELLGAGHTVVAGVRQNHHFEMHPSLEIQTCDGTALDDVKRLIRGCDAVVSVIGHRRGSRADVQTATTMNIVRVARHAGLSRVVSLTGTGVRFAGDRVDRIDRFLNLAIRLIDPQRIQDGLDHAEILKASGLDWTLVRVLKLTSGRPGQFQLLPHGPGKLLVPRAEVALAIRSVLENNSHIRQAPILGPIKLGDSR